MAPEQLERIRSRVSAYVYGNVLVLAAVVGCSPDSVTSGRAVLVVGATTATTYVAHVLAHRVGEGVGRSADDAQVHLRAELRDAVPIASSGLLPCAVLLLAALGWLGPLGTAGAQLLAALLVVVRLGLAGVVVGRHADGGTPRTALWSGVGLAVAGMLVAVVKVVLTH